MGFFSISEWLLLGCVCRRGRISTGCAWHPNRPRVGIYEKNWEMKLGLVTSLFLPFLYMGPNLKEELKEVGLQMEGLAFPFLLLTPV